MARVDLNEMETVLDVEDENDSEFTRPVGGQTDEKPNASDRDAPPPLPNPNTKAAMINAAVNKMMKMDKKTLKDSYSRLMGEQSSDEEDEEIDFEESFSSLFSDEKNLTETFKHKAATLFEAAVNRKVNEGIKEAYSEMNTLLDEEKESLASEVNKYLTYVAENWLKENRLAVENGIRSEISESFLSSLRTVFEDHYIDIPDSKTDIVEELADKVVALEEQIDGHLKNNVSLGEELSELQKTVVFLESTGDLSERQAAKLADLIESTSFTNIDGLREKIGVLKEEYIESSSGKRDVSLSEDIGVTDDSDGSDTLTEDRQEKKVISPTMKAYAAAISRGIPK